MANTKCVEREREETSFMNTSKSPTKILTWSEVRPIFEYYLSVWSNSIPLGWSMLAWQSLHKKGLTVFNSDEEELKARSYAVALSLIYYEYCFRTAFHERRGFQYWDDSILKTLKNDFIEDYYNDGNLLFEPWNALVSKYGDLETCAELWINCQESYQGFPFSLKEKAECFRNLVSDHNNDFCYDQGQRFLLGGVDDLSDYQSISGIGLFEFQTKTIRD